MINNALPGSRKARAMIWVTLFEKLLMHATIELHLVIYEVPYVRSALHRSHTLTSRKMNVKSDEQCQLSKKS